MSARCKKCNSNGYNFGNFCDCYVVTEREYIENLKSRIAELENELIETVGFNYEKTKRIAELEANILEAGQAYCMPGKTENLESAELSLVRMAHEGSNAMSRIAELKEENDEFIKIIDDYSGKEFQWNKEIERLKAEREWQPIETAPKDTLWKIVTNGTATFPAYYEGGWKDSDGEFIYSRLGIILTHWMPLPKPPEEK